MNRFKQKVKIKEAVRLRTKSLANGSQSLYLDTYHKGKRVYEFLRLYLIPEKSAADKAVNVATMRAATAIKASRTLDFINAKADIKSPVHRSSIQRWIEHMIDEKRAQRSVSMVRLLRRLLRHLNNYRPCTDIADADRDFCIGFVDYLRVAHALNSEKPLMQATQFELINALSLTFNEAVREGLISSNPMRMLNASERIKRPESSREYLTPEEVKSMIRVSADNISAGDDVAAFLFCCFCGLRYSDVTRLTWQNIFETDRGMTIVTTMKKTQRRVEVPVSKTAASILPLPGDPTGKVFSFPRYGITLKKLTELAKDAGIKKK